MHSVPVQFSEDNESEPQKRVVEMGGAIVFPGYATLNHLVHSVGCLGLIHHMQGGLQLMYQMDGNLM